MAERGPVDESERARWQRIESLLDAALDLPAAERDGYLAATCGTDRSLRDEVLRIIAAGERDGTHPLPAIGELAAAMMSGAAAAEPVPVVRIPEHIGRYRVIRELGHGGMGSVYLAERDDGEYRQTVALKVVRRGLHHDERTVRRFRDERQTLAALQHPDIARLLDGGVTEEGLPYFAMEYISGQPIDRFCDERRLTIEQRLALFARVCEATAYAHAQGVVHRDIKPSNILVSEDGTPKLLDFGIAKLAQADDAAAKTFLTRTGERLLTPEYASPEQVRGETATAASDVYALGVLLYELLTGQWPYRRQGLTPREIERATLEDEPTRPSTVVTRPAAAGDASHIERVSATRGSTPARLKQRLRGDLDSIVLQALRKDPRRRYASAGELAADVRRHLAGRPVLARGEGVLYRSRVWARRHRRTVLSGVVGMALGVTAITALAFRADRRAEQWIEARGLIDEVSTRSPAARRYYEDGLRALADGQLADAVRSFRAALGEDSTFAMAAFYGANAAQWNEDYMTARDLRELSVRHAGSGSDRERLIVMTSYAAQMGHASLRSYADTLNERFPSTALGAFWSARAAFLGGNWARAIAEAERTIQLDSLSIREQFVPCYACDALLMIAESHLWNDDFDQAERAAERAVALLPNSAAAWRQLALVQLFRGDPPDSAYRRTIALDPGDTDFAVEWLADASLRRGDFETADPLLRTRMRTAPPARVERALGLLITSMRMQERWAEAMQLAEQFRALPQPDTGIAMARHVAIILLETGRPAQAAALFDSISQWHPERGEQTPEFRLWNLTHRATALAAAGDTADLASIADTIRALAPLSANGRDARLPDHVEGLLLAARGDDEAAARAFRRAIFTWNRGYTRTNYELARVLLRLRRPGEAVAALQPAFRGSLEVSNSYITHTALHRLLAHAWREAGAPDSATVHEAWVARAVAR